MARPGLGAAGSWCDARELGRSDEVSAIDRDESPSHRTGVTVRRTGHVLHVVIDRPHRLNALDAAARTAIVAAVDGAGEDPGVWVVVIRGAGGRAFSVGADLKEMAGPDLTGGPRRPMAGLQRNVFEAVLECRCPTLAAIDGYALGGGLELALACDLRLATQRSSFGVPEARLGMGANFASVVLPRVVPRGIALQMLYLGERIDAVEAHRVGLVNWVVPQDGFGSALDDVLHRLTRSAPLSLRRYKAMTVKGWELPVSAALRLDVGPDPYASQDRAEGIAAFFAKRRPSWTGH